MMSTGRLGRPGGQHHQEDKNPYQLRLEYATVGTTLDPTRINSAGALLG